LGDKMVNTRSTKKTIIIMLLAVSTCFILSSGCYKQYYFPVEVADVTISPAYELEIKNSSTQQLTFQPRDGASVEIKEKKISVGESFSILVQIKKIKVGSTITREVVDGPYIDSGRLGPDTAYLEYKYSVNSRELERELVIDLKSDSWFKQYETTGMNEDPRPRILRVELTDQNLSKQKWFRNGPDNP
jgi:hypothetical protein